MKQKNNMSAPTAAIDSRTRMRRSDIRTRCMCDGILGPAPPYLAMTEPSTNQRLDQEKLTPVGIAARNSLDLVSPLRDTCDTSRSRIGMSVSAICRTTTSSGSVTAPRSSTGLIIFANTSSTATRELAGSGPICWKTHA